MLYICNTIIKTNTFMRDFTTSKSGLIHVVIFGGEPIAAFCTSMCMYDFLENHCNESNIRFYTYYNSETRRSSDMVSFLKKSGFCFSGAYPNLFRSINY